MFDYYYACIIIILLPRQPRAPHAYLIKPFQYSWYHFVRKRLLFAFAFYTSQQVLLYYSKQSGSSTQHVLHLSVGIHVIGWQYWVKQFPLDSLHSFYTVKNKIILVIIFIMFNLYSQLPFELYCKFGRTMQNHCQNRCYGFVVPELCNISPATIGHGFYSIFVSIFSFA